jgi:hypothetical protein
MEGYILRSKKSKHGRKWLVRHKKTGKTAKAEKPLPPPTSHYSSTPQQDCHKKSLKGEVQVHSHHISISHLASTSIHLTFTTPPTPSSSIVQHPTFPPFSSTPPLKQEKICA